MTQKKRYPIKGTELEDFSVTKEMPSRGSDIINKLFHAAARCRTAIPTADMMSTAGVEEYRCIDS